jgi:hypothetical protein
MSNEMIPFAEVQQLATAVARSRLFKAFDNPETALVLMMVAQAEGCHPIQATQRYDVIQGKPAKKADAMLADFQQRGGKVTWKQLDDTAAEGEFMGPGLGAPVTIRWTIEMATNAGLTGKGTWKQYPRAMLRSRVVSEGIRTAMPGVVAGLYTPEEVGDFDAALPTRPETKPVVPSDPVVDAEIVPRSLAPLAHATADEPTPSDDPKIKAAKVRALVIAIKDAGIPEAERKDWMGIKLGKTVESSKDLTIVELDTLMAEVAKLPVVQK